jgi:transglutaminase-like putative cysteine protease
MVLLVLNAIISIAIVGLITHFALEDRLVRQYVRSVTIYNPGDTSLSAATLIAGRVYHDVVPRPDDKSFIPVPLLSSLGATPGGVLRDGGCCSGTSRLAIVALHAAGIPAGQVTLYHSGGYAQHCLVEVVCPEGRAVIDPTYGLLFVDSEGSVLGLPELRAGALPTFRSLPESSKTAYPDNDYYNFDFANTKTTNWTKSWRRRSAHRLLSFLTRGHIDKTWQPVFLEWPQLVLATGLVAILIAATLLNAAH